MNAARMRECLDIIHWPLRTLARVLNRHGWNIEETTVRQGWARDRELVPDDIAEWLEMTAAFHQSHPPPPRVHVNAIRYSGRDG